MTRRTLPQKVERGQDIAHAILRTLFHAFVFAVFAPPALRALQSGDMIEAGTLAACAIGLGVLLAPRPS